eukprot:TRINITY_DN1949_c0_g1_i1.p1 TRINITY_DN1949_c0_g1~~TRINITY_DN1949_c0_g1_i1.p1  ORF type:complete len:844 (+),score=96.25 TRINITY_DN1949_c0_g1_i1:45-2576(+)
MRRIGESDHLLRVKAAFCMALFIASFVPHQNEAVAQQWKLQSRVVPYDTQSGDYFGSVVAISDNYALVTSPTFRYTSYYYLVKVLVRSQQTWSYQTTLYPSSTYSSGYFGNALSLTDNWAMIGEPNYSYNYYYSGAVHTFSRSGSSWNQISRLTTSDLRNYDYFGSSISNTDNFAIFGASSHDSDGYSDRGAAYIFSRSSNSWSYYNKLTPSDTYSSSVNFGSSVSITDSIAIVGAQGFNNYEGAVYVYTYSYGAWNYHSRLMGRQMQSEYFGMRVLAHSDRLIIGTNMGFVYTFTQQNQVWSNSNMEFSNFRVVSRSKEYYIHGSTQENSNTGAVYIYINDEPKSGSATRSRSRSVRKTRSRSRSRSLRKTRSKSRSRTRSGRKSRSKSRSRTKSMRKSRSKSRSRSRSRSRSGSESRSRSNSRSKSRSMFNTNSFSPFSGQRVVSKITQTRSDSAGLGTTVQMDGDFAAVTQPVCDITASSCIGGAVIMLELKDGDASVHSVLQKPDKKDARISSTMYLSGGFLFVTHLIPKFRDSDVGAVYVFAYSSSSNSWIRHSTLVARSKQLGEDFGRSISFYRNVSVVGAPGNDLNPDKRSAGCVYVFALKGGRNNQNGDSNTSGFGKFKRLGNVIYATDATADDRFGSSLSLFGHRLAIGNEPRDESREAVYIFEDRAGLWTQMHRLSRPGSSRFGATILMHESGLLVAAPRDSFRAPEEGSVSSYAVDTDGTFQLRQVLRPRFIHPRARFGVSVAMNRNRAAIGTDTCLSPLTTSSCTQGVVYIWDYSYRAASWRQVRRLFYGLPDGKDAFGISVAIQNSHVLVGAPRDTQDARHIGAAYLVQL